MGSAAAAPQVFDSDGGSMKTFALSALAVLILIAMPTPVPAATTAFFDDFNRPNSNNVGNGWSECETLDDHIAIIDNRLSFPSPVHAATIYRPHEGGAGGHNVSITWNYTTQLIQNDDAVSARYHPSSCANADTGLTMRLDDFANVLEIRDQNSLIATANFVFNSNIDYAFQWDIYSDNSMAIWAWEASDPKPAHATFRVDAFTPISEGTNWALGNRGASPSITSKSKA